MTAPRRRWSAAYFFFARPALRAGAFLVAAFFAGRAAGFFAATFFAFVAPPFFAAPFDAFFAAGRAALVAAFAPDLDAAFLAVERAGLGIASILSSGAAAAPHVDGPAENRPDFRCRGAPEGSGV